MTVESTSSVVTFLYTGPGIYSYSFKAYLNSDITISYLDAFGNVTILSEGTDYTLVRDSDNVGGSVTSVYAPTTGTLEISRVLPITQSVALENQGPLSMDTLETAFDRNIMILQQLNDKLEGNTSASNWRGFWATDTDYTLKDFVEYDTNWYACLETHTSGTFATDLASSKWRLVLDIASIYDEARDLMEDVADNMTAIGERSDAIKTDHYTATTGQTAFTITQPTKQENILVFLNTRKLRLTEDYTLNSTTAASVLTLNSGAAAGDELDIISFNTYDLTGLAEDLATAVTDAETAQAAAETAETNAEAAQAAAEAAQSGIEVLVNKGLNDDIGSVAVGTGALDSTTTATNNVAVGNGALGSCTGSSGNVAVGYSALSSLTSTYLENTAVGTNAAKVFTGGSMVAVGYDAGASATTGGNNTLIGHKSGCKITTGGSNTVVGESAFSTSQTGDGNTSIGNQSLFVSNGGQNNTALGAVSGASCTTGSYNCLIGRAAGYAITTGNHNTAVGYQAMLSGNWTNSTALGYASVVTGDNQVQLGNSSTTTYAFGAVQNRSDKRDKTDIRDTSLGLSFVMSLRPVDFKWDMRDDYHSEVRDGSKKRTRFHHGFIAQEVPEFFGGFQNHSLNGGKDVMSLGYTEFIAPLVRAIQEQQKIISELEQKLNSLIKTS